jgi:class 3 adenylate cyclase
LNDARPERRLAAILAADEAGYSQLVGLDEEGTIGQLRAHRALLFDPQVAPPRGRIVKTTGDRAKKGLSATTGMARDVRTRMLATLDPSPCILTIRTHILWRSPGCRSSIVLPRSTRI